MKTEQNLQEKLDELVKSLEIQKGNEVESARIQKEIDQLKWMIEKNQSVG